MLQAALGRRKQVTVFGTDYETPDGTCIRDYIHVADLADAHLVALEALENGRGSAVFNVGTGQGHSVWEVIRTAEEVSGRAIPVQEGPRRQGDPPVLVADGRRLRELGWRPRYGLREIVASAWAWHRGQGRFLGVESGLVAELPGAGYKGRRILLIGLHSGIVLQSDACRTHRTGFHVRSAKGGPCHDGGECVRVMVITGPTVT